MGCWFGGSAVFGGEGLRFWRVGQLWYEEFLVKV